MSFVKIHSLFSDSLKRNSLERGVNDTQVLEACQKALVEIFGSQIVFQAKTLSYQNETIKLSVLSSVLSSRIKLQEEKVLKLTNKFCRQKKVSRLILRLD